MLPQQFAHEAGMGLPPGPDREILLQASYHLSRIRCCSLQFS
jgi:hypothetical protein